MAKKHLARTDKSPDAPAKGSFGTPQSPKCIGEAVHDNLNPQIIRTTDGYPVISIKEYMRMDRILSDNNVKVTFDFRGFVESNHDHKQQYVDILSTNCLRDGIRLTVVGGGAESWETDLQNPSEVRMYEFGIMLPSEVQEEENMDDRFITIRISSGIGRENIKRIYSAVIAYLEMNHPLGRVEDFVRGYERYLLQRPNGDFERLADPMP